MSAAAPAEEPKRWSRAADEKLKKTFLKEVRDKCQPELEAFAQCAKKANLAVAFTCRQENRTANECLHQFSGDEHWLAYRAEKKKAWMAEGKLRADTPLP